MNKIIRLQAVLSLAGIRKADGPFDDEQIMTSCPACGNRQTLGQANVRLEAGQTRYRCTRGCQDIAFISDRILGEAGYKLGDFVFRNLSDVFFQGRNKVVQVPAAHKLAPEIELPWPASAADDLPSRSAD